MTIPIDCYYLKWNLNITLHPIGNQISVFDHPRIIEGMPQSHWKLSTSLIGKKSAEAGVPIIMLPTIRHSQILLLNDDRLQELGCIHNYAPQLYLAIIIILVF